MIWLPTSFLFHANHAAPEVVIDAPHPAALSLNLGTPPNFSNKLNEHREPNI